MTRAMVLATERGAMGGVVATQRRRARGVRALALAVACSVAALMAVVATPALAAVPPPTNVHANAEGTTQVALAWTASTAGTSGAGAITSYKVLRNGSQIGTTDPYTTNYLDTGRAANTPYTYTVIAVSGSNSSAPSNGASPTTAASVQTLTQCSTTPYGSGHYALGANLIAPTGQPCLQFSSATNVSLDCQGHSISIQQGLGDNYAAAVSLPGDNGFLVVNCSFYDESPPVTGSPNSDNIVSVTNSSNGVFENDTIAMGQGVEWAYSYKTTAVAFNSDVFTNAPVDQQDGSGDYFGNNAATIPSQIGADDLALSSPDIGGAAHPVVPSNNVIDANRLDGSTDLGGYPTSKGADDVIGVDQESGDVFANNRINNGYDCGIELGDLFQGGTITNNVFSNDWAAGICSYWFTSWVNNMVSANTVIQGGTLATINGATSLAAGQSTNYMTGNVFSGNVLEQATFHIYWHGAVNMTGWAGNSLATVTPTNTFTTNNFGNGLLAPVIDAGIVGTQSGNLCQAPSPPNITCGTPVNGAAPAPSIDGVYPPQGPSGGATAVTIEGSGFTAATQVLFGSSPGTITKIKSDSEIVAVSPAGTAGTVDVKVVTPPPAGTSAVTAGDHFTYGNFPVVTAVSPAQALAGSVVTITGSNFTGATAVDFGSLAARSFTVSPNGSSITATSPAAVSGTVNVTVTTPTGTSAVTGGIAPTGPNDQFTVGSGVPSVASLAPSAGGEAGGTTVTITGSNFVAGATTVSFGGAAATSVSVVNGGQLSAVSPAGNQGVVDVTVTTAQGTSATNASDQFTYIPPQGVRTESYFSFASGSNFTDLRLPIDFNVLAVQTSWSATVSFVNASGGDIGGLVTLTGNSLNADGSLNATLSFTVAASGTTSFAVNRTISCTSGATSSTCTTGVTIYPDTVDQLRVDLISTDGAGDYTWNAAFTGTSGQQNAGVITVPGAVNVDPAANIMTQTRYLGTATSCAATPQSDLSWFSPFDGSSKSSYTGSIAATNTCNTVFNPINSGATTGIEVIAPY